MAASDRQTVLTAPQEVEDNLVLAVRNRQLAAVNQLLKNIAGRWSTDADTVPAPAESHPRAVTPR